MTGDTACVLRDLERTGSRPIVVASHPRSGTHLCIDLLRLNFQPCRSRKAWFERADRLYFGLDALGRADVEPDLRLFNAILSRVPRPLVKTHAMPDLSQGGVQRRPWRLNPEVAEWFRERAAFVYTYRDGREVLRSLYHYMQDFAPEARVPFSQFIRQEIRGMSRARVWADHVRSWCAHPRALCLSMEKVRESTKETLAILMRSLDLPPAKHPPRLPSRCNADVWSRAWRRLVPEPTSTAIVAFPKHECFSNWEEAFAEPADREFFHREAGDMLIELGYETSDRWVAGSATNRDAVVEPHPPLTRSQPSNPQPHRPATRERIPASNREQAGLVHA